MTELRSVENQIKIATDEYYFLQNEVGRYDDISHKIKNWSITTCFALIGAAFYKDIPFLLIASSAIAILFWATESIWKLYQQIHLTRIEYIEDYLSGKSGNYEGPGIRRHFKASLPKGIKYVSALISISRYTNVVFPHGVLFIFGFILYIFLKVFDKNLFNT